MLKHEKTNPGRSRLLLCLYDKTFSPIFLPISANFSQVNYHEIEQQIWDNFGTGEEIHLDGVNKGELPAYTSDFLKEYQNPYSDTHDLVVSKPAVKCKPMPGKVMGVSESVQ